jgi:formylglycine-generating enzyme required for sulfatase activity
VLLVCCFAVACRAQEAPTGARAEALPPTRVNPKDGAEMVLVPAGEFRMGSSEQELAAWLAAHPTDKREWFTDELPQRSVYLDAYYIYKTEVTVAQYRTFCQATGRQMPPPPPWGWQDAHPIVNVTWDDAKAYADWAGVALPTEAQWEKAARGTEGRLFPWGSAWPPPAKVGNFADEACKRSGKYKDWTFIAGYDDGYAETAPVGSFPAGASPYGVLDMAGNVWEWCGDWYDSNYYQTAPTKNPTGPEARVRVQVLPGIYVTGRVVRGGSWCLDDPGIFRGARRSGGGPSGRYYGDGFRCARGL